MSKSREIVPEVLYADICTSGSECDETIPCEGGFRYFLKPGTNNLVRIPYADTRPLIGLDIISSIYKNRRHRICVDFISFTNQQGILEEFLTKRRTEKQERNEIDLINEYWKLFDSVNLPRSEEIFPASHMYKYWHKTLGEITFRLGPHAEKGIIDYVVALVFYQQNSGLRTEILEYIKNEGKE